MVNGPTCRNPTGRLWPIGYFSTLKISPDPIPGSIIGRRAEEFGLRLKAARLTNAQEAWLSNV
jgi:hypothetical protein